MKFLICLFAWFLLLVVCWPLALLLAVLAPVLWLLWQPFRLLGIVIGGVFALIKAILYLPARLLGYRQRRPEAYPT